MAWHGPMHGRYADARHPRKLHAHLPCRTIESETRAMRIKMTADMLRALSRVAAGLAMRFQKVRQSLD
jgi:hypothetical protein